MLQAYRDHVAERAALGIPPLPLDVQQTAAVIELLKTPPAGEGEFLLDLLTYRVPPGVDDAAKVKASFLAAVAHGDLTVGLLPPARATELLGTMVGGYNVKPLIDLLDDAAMGPIPTPMGGDTLVNGGPDCRTGSEFCTKSTERSNHRELTNQMF
jgi:aconitate hydratase 2/2-methylisocitrate dehydratase